MNQQNIQQNQSQQILPQPPNIVTVKDSLYLTDMLSWNLIAMKKAHFFAKQCHDPEISAVLNKVGKMHQKHYQTVLTHLNTTSSQQSIGTH
jgi:spore coat protein CotF